MELTRNPFTIIADYLVKVPEDERKNLRDKFELPSTDFEKGPIPVLVQNATDLADCDIELTMEDVLYMANYLCRQTLRRRKGFLLVAEIATRLLASEKIKNCTFQTKERCVQAWQYLLCKSRDQMRTECLRQEMEYLDSWEPITE